jgi:glycosyltransferase involved in cell wall biosynthesis
MADQARPRVSVCLLTYNRAQVLRRSLDSLLSQTYRDFELIINDDCSSDETPQICHDYVSRGQRVRYYRNEKNLRYAGNQNAALARAQGELVAIVHDGDIYRRDCLEKWVDAMINDPTVGIVFNASDALDDKGDIVVRYRHPYRLVTRGTDMLDEMFRLYSSPIFGIVMVRKKLALLAGGFDENYPILGDVDMWMRILMLSDVAYINEPLFQIHPREAGHTNQGVNWRILSEHHCIFMCNARRRFEGQEGKREQVLSALRRKYQAKLLHSCLWALKRGRWRLALEGAKYLAEA